MRLEAADVKVNYGEVLAKQYKEMAASIREGFGDDWKNSLDAAWVMLENWMSQVGMSEEMKQFAKIQFSFEWGDKNFTSLWPTIKKKLNEQIANDDSAIGKSIKEKILNGEALSDEEAKYAKNLVRNIAKSIADNPALSDKVKDAILKAFNNGKTAVKIIAQITSNDGKPWKSFMKRELAELNNDPKNKIRLMIDQAGTVSDVWAAIQKAHDNAQDELKKLKGLKLPIDINFNGKKINYKDALQKGGVWDDWVKARSGKKDISKKNIQKANEIMSYVTFFNELVDTMTSTEAFAKKENYDLEANKKGKKNNDGSKKDAIAEAWKNRLAVMREYADEFDKLVARVGKDNAMLQMEERSKAMGWNAILPSGFNRKDPRKSIRNYYNKEVKDKAKTTEQKNVAKDYAKYLFNVDDSDAKDQIDKVLSGIQKQISDKQKKWSLYSKAKESTGDASVAVSLAFGSGADAENAVADYRKMLETYLKQNKIDISIDDLLGMSEEDILGNSKLGERNGKPIVAMTKAISDATAKEAERTVNNYLRILKESQDYDAKLKALAQQEQTDLLDLQSRGGTEEQQKALQDSYTEKRGKVLFEQFQKNSGWEKLFDDLGRVSNTSLDEFERQINKFATTAGLGVTETKALVNAIKKVREEQISRNPLKYIWEGITHTNTIKGFMQNATANADGSYNVDATQAAAMGISKTGIISKKEMQSMSDDRDKEIDDNFVKGLESASNALKSFENVLSPVADLFSAMGNDTMSDAVNIGSSALSSAASTASSFSSLSTIAEGAGLGEGTSKILGKVGAFGAAASAALSVTTGLFSLYDKAIQKEIDASKERQKEAANLFKNLKSALEEGYGGFYSSTNNYDEMLASLKAQRDEVAYQLAKEQSRGSRKDTGTISDLKQELKEAQDTIDQFAETMAKELYSVDFKSYSSTLADTLVSAWSEGKSAAESYGDAVNDILKNVATSVVKQKWIENLIEPLADDFMEQFEKNDGVVDENMMALLSQIYDLSEEATNATNSYMDAMEYIANQHGETLKNVSTGTLANGIESITEDTADLLAGYINSIRADTSILRATNTEILKAVQGMSGMPVIARSQLEQLNVIAENTSRSAENAEMIYGILNKVTNGSLQFAIK